LVADEDFRGNVPIVVWSTAIFVGAALIWAPAAVLSACNGLHLGVVLLAFGIRYRSGRQHIAPLLVGKMPDYVVLISTLGGLAAFGLNGFVIGPVIAAMIIAAWDIFSESASVDSGED
jgi:predicted PurR-regulated permease PerM